MRIVVTGGNGFIGQNLRVRLRELGHRDVLSVTRQMDETEVGAVISGADFVFHLAGVNRPSDDAEFRLVNTEFTERVCNILESTGRRIPLVYASSTQVGLDNPYGNSKLYGESAATQYGVRTASPVFILRLTNVFGKWARPNYNSAVATFCHNMTRGLPVTVSDPGNRLTLLYIDDVVSSMIKLLDHGDTEQGLVEVGPIYSTTLGDLVGILESFGASRRTLMIPAVGVGLTRALHATYLSYLPPTEFAYTLQSHSDARGVFVEMLKTLDCGQISYFTAPPGVTRGEHYHHSKTEKFLVVQGSARFDFRHIITNETFDIVADGHAPRIIETVPGWAHCVTNVGTSDVVVMLWASETFDPLNPDTIASKVRTW